MTTGIHLIKLEFLISRCEWNCAFAKQDNVRLREKITLYTGLSKLSSTHPISQVLSHADIFVASPRCIAIQLAHHASIMKPVKSGTSCLPRIYSLLKRLRTSKDPHSQTLKLVATCASFLPCNDSKDLRRLDPFYLHFHFL